jgi:replication initiator protein RepSA
MGVPTTVATDNAHHRRVRATAHELADRGRHEGPYALLGKWVHMLGFRGHFASKSRRYSITLGALRRARRRAQAFIAQHWGSGRPLDLSGLEVDLLADDDAETIPGHWSLAIRRLGLAHRRTTRPGRCSRRTSARVRAMEGSAVTAKTSFGREGMVMNAKFEDRLWSVQEVSEYLGGPHSHDLRVAQRCGRVLLVAESGSDSGTGHRMYATGWPRSRRRSCNEAPGTG